MHWVASAFWFVTLAALAASSVYVAHRSYAEASEEHGRDVKMARMCSSHAELREHMPDACALHMARYTVPVYSRTLHLMGSAYYALLLDVKREVAPYVVLLGVVALAATCLYCAAYRTFSRRYAYNATESYGGASTLEQAAPYSSYRIDEPGAYRGRYAAAIDTQQAAYFGAPPPPPLSMPRHRKTAHVRLIN